MTLSGPVWFVVLALVGLMALGVLHCLATAIRKEVELHELRIRVAILRQAQLERLRRLSDRTVVTVDEEPGEAPARKAA